MTTPPGALDQAVIDAGRALAAALRADPYDKDAAAQARVDLEAARAARWPDDA